MEKKLFENYYYENPSTEAEEKVNQLLDQLQLCQEDVFRRGKTIENICRGVYQFLGKDLSTEDLLFIVSKSIPEKLDRQFYHRYILKDLYDMNTLKRDEIEDPE